MEDWVEKTGDKNKSKEKVGRRGALKLAAGVAVGLGVIKGADWIEDKKYNLNRPENFREFLEEKENMVPARLKNRVWIMEGVKLYNEPAKYKEYKQSRIVSTRVDPDRTILTVSEEDRFPVDHGFILLRKADSLTFKDYKVEVEGEEYDLLGSWMVVKPEGMVAEGVKKEISSTQNKIAFVHMTDVVYQVNDDEGESSLRSRFDPSYIMVEGTKVE